MSVRPRRLVAAGIVMIVVLASLVACAVAPSARADHWVVVRFDATLEASDLDVMDVLVDTELAADEALRAAGAGYIDGNEIGGGQYDLFFVGADRAAMWAILEPVFASAPVSWTRVELRDGSEDPTPTVITP